MAAVLTLELNGGNTVLIENTKKLTIAKDTYFIFRYLIDFMSINLTFKGSNKTKYKRKIYLYLPKITNNVIKPMKKIIVQIIPGDFIILDSSLGIVKTESDATKYTNGSNTIPDKPRL